jgi:glutaredoxin
MIMKAIRWFLGKLILALNALFPPKLTVTRSSADQTRVDQECTQLSLYQFEACPFCVKVRRAIKRMGLRIELRDAQKNEAFAQELLAGGGQRQVPCLRIVEGSGTRWLYESSDIIAYLESRFA